MKKLLALLLCFAMLLSLLAACGTKEGADDPDTPKTEPQEKMPDPLLIENLADYVIIYPELGTSLDVMAAIRALRDAIRQKLSVRLDMKDDFLTDKIKIQTREILVGKTNRPESAAVYAKVPRVNDYAVQIVDEKLVFAASSDEMLVQMLETVTTAINELTDADTAFFTPEQQLKVLGTYDIDCVTIDGTNLNEYTVVCPNTPAVVAMAEMLIDSIFQTYQYKLTYTLENNVETPEKAILFGNTKFGLPDGVVGVGDDQSYIGVANGNFYIYATDETVLYQTIHKLASQPVDPATNRVSIDLTDLIEKPKTTTLTAMSFNIWGGNASTVAARTQHVIERIKSVMPDTIGLQESGAPWIKALKAGLADEYVYVGEAADPNATGESSGIMYRKSTLRLIDSGTKWLTDTPDKVSKYPESEYIRVMTYAVYERISDGKRFVHINTHPDHTGSPGTIRLKQLKVVIKYAQEHFSDLPIVLTGDLNATESTPEIQYVLNNGFDNGSKIAYRTTSSPTFTPHGSIIDYCMTSENDFFVYEYAVDSYKYKGDKDYQKDNCDPSDHCPVYIRFEIK